VRHLWCQGQESIVFGLVENAPRDQLGDRPLANLEAPLGGALYPIHRVVLLFDGRDVGQRRVEQIITNRSRIRQRQRLDIGIDAICQLQLPSTPRRRTPDALCAL
jgi:hypothetical protein